MKGWLGVRSGFPVPVYEQSRGEREERGQLSPAPGSLINPSAILDQYDRRTRRSPFFIRSALD